jgi:hypothetical protein
MAEVTLGVLLEGTPVVIFGRALEKPVERIKEVLEKLLSVLFVGIEEFVSLLIPCDGSNCRATSL